METKPRRPRPFAELDIESTQYGELLVSLCYEVVELKKEIVKLEERLNKYEMDKE